ncbi:hypothetical protein AAZV13_15G086400 [Glycine max]
MLSHNQRSNLPQSGPHIRVHLGSIIVAGHSQVGKLHDWKQGFQQLQLIILLIGKWISPLRGLDSRVGYVVYHIAQGSPSSHLLNYMELLLVAGHGLDFCWRRYIPVPSCSLISTLLEAHFSPKTYLIIFYNFIIE